MKRKIRYTDEPLGEIVPIPDFLPPPDQLVFKEDEVKVTLTLSQKSVDFFKSRAARHRTPYQRMIRRLLDRYVEAHKGTKARSKK